MKFLMVLVTLLTAGSSFRPFSIGLMYQPLASPPQNTKLTDPPTQTNWTVPGGCTILSMKLTLTAPIEGSKDMFTFTIEPSTPGVTVYGTCNDNTTEVVGMSWNEVDTVANNMTVGRNITFTFTMDNKTGTYGLSRIQGMAETYVRDQKTNQTAAMFLFLSGWFSPPLLSVKVENSFSCKHVDAIELNGTWSNSTVSPTTIAPTTTKTTTAPTTTKTTTASTTTKNTTAPTTTKTTTASTTNATTTATTTTVTTTASTTNATTTAPTTTVTTTAPTTTATTTAPITPTTTTAPTTTAPTTTATTTPPTTTPTTTAATTTVTTSPSTPASTTAAQHTGKVLQGARVLRAAIFAAADNATTTTSKVSNTTSATTITTANTTTATTVPTTTAAPSWNVVVVLQLDEIKIDAFRKNGTLPGDYQTAVDCTADKPNDIIPIVIGCVLAGLVVVVLVAYLVGRRLAQAREYTSMD